MSESLLAVRGSPGSPYTRKMLALLRFRRIPYRYIQCGMGDAGLPQPKVQLVPVFYFENDAGELDAEVDSTPIIRRLEDEYGDRSVIPTDPASAFLNYLVEDYGDEWLTKAMFHYRWYYEADIDMAGSVLPHYDDVTQDDETIARRLFFVGLTRSRRNLFLSYHGTEPHPYVQDIPERLLHHVECEPPRSAKSAGSGEVPEQELFF